MAEIKIRAERRAGELLQEIPREPGKRTDQPTATPAAGSEYRKALEQAGIKERTARSYQTIAKIPEPVFEAHVAETKAARQG